MRLQIHTGCASQTRIRRKCCVQLPREERATRDVTFGSLCISLWTTGICEGYCSRASKNKNSRNILVNWCLRLFSTSSQGKSWHIVSYFHVIHRRGLQVIYDDISTKTCVWYYETYSYKTVPMQLCVPCPPPPPSCPQGIADTLTACPVNLGAKLRHRFTQVRTQGWQGMITPYLQTCHDVRLPFDTCFWGKATTHVMSRAIILSVP
jgi:hypothetical protein